MIRCEHRRRIRVIVMARSDCKLERIVVDRERHAHIPETRVLVDDALQLVTQWGGVGHKQWGGLVQGINLTAGCQQSAAKPDRSSHSSSWTYYLCPEGDGMRVLQGPRTNDVTFHIRGAGQISRPQAA